MDEALKEAVRLRELGFAIHWLVPGQKRPIQPGWTDSPVMSVDELMDTYRTGMNVGFRAGKWSVVAGKEVAVIDVDIRGGERFADEAYAATRSLLGTAYRPHVISGSGVGQHQYVLFPIGKSPKSAATVLRQADLWVTPDRKIHPHHAEGAKPVWQIELLSTGKNVVLPPSIHPDTGLPYKWATERTK